MTTMSNETSCSSTIPVIDIAELMRSDCLTEEYQEISVTIAKACSDHGFFYIKNHGVDEQIVNDVIDVWREFIALPLSEKEKVMSVGGDNFRGYFKFLTETSGYLKENSEPDWREGLYLAQELPENHPSKKKYPTVTQNNRWPQHPAYFKTVVEKYFNALKHVSFKLMSALAIGLGLNKDFFEPLFTPYPLAQLGMFCYHTCLKTTMEKRITCGEHTDYGILTILLQSDSGLEVITENGEWIPVPPIPDTFVVNLGDMLEVWSNGAYKANEHRVRDNLSKGQRISMAFFCGPCPDSVIEPLPLHKPLINFKSRNRNKNIKIPVTFGDYLAKKYKGTFGK